MLPPPRAPQPPRMGDDFIPVTAIADAVMGNADVQGELFEGVSAISDERQQRCAEGVMKIHEQQPIKTPQGTPHVLCC